MNTRGLFWADSAMSNAADAPRILSTTELCRQTSITRNVLSRLREQYADRMPPPLRLGNALGWPVEAIDAVRDVLAFESRCSGTQ